MKQSYKKSFLLAIIIYLPILLLFYEISKSLPKPQDLKKPEHFVINYLTKSEIEDIFANPPAKPSKTTKPQTAITAAKKEPDQSDFVDESPQDETISVDQLNSAFTPLSQNHADHNKTEVVSTKEIMNLYGDLLLVLTEEEKKFLENNLENIGVITQRYLRYPDLAGQLGMHGETILYFTLMPNGDITPIELFKSSGFSILDDNAIDTVERAYKDYPYPKEPTRIRLRVIYRLY